MDNFILENDTWLRYLPIIIYALIVVIVVLLIIIGFLILKKYRNKSLKSQRRRSTFAAAYADCFVPNASSSAPLKRGPVVHEPDMHFTHVNPAARIPDRPKPVAPPPTKSVSASVSSDRQIFTSNPRILDFYFEFEDEYKI